MLLKLLLQLPIVIKCQVLLMQQPLNSALQVLLQLILATPLSLKLLLTLLQLLVHAEELLRARVQLIAHQSLQLVDLLLESLPVQLCISQLLLQLLLPLYALLQVTH